MGTDTMRIPKRAKVWNRGDRDFKHIVRGKEVFIPQGGYIECARSEAMTIKGHCTGKHEPVTLVVELIDAGGPQNEVFIDHRTGTQYPTKDALLRALGVDPKEVDKARNAMVYSCPACDQTFEDADEAKKHMAVCLAKFMPAEEESKKSTKSK